MEQNETAAPAPVVRQLDFSVRFKASTEANANANGISILPEHPQAQLQAKLLALAQSQHLHARARSRSPPQIVAQAKLPPRKMVTSHKLPAGELPRMVELVKSPPIAPGLTHPVTPAPMPKPAFQPLLKTESPKSRGRFIVEPKEATPKKQKKCNCKNSRCLKLYCECFATGSYCDGCNCINCHNKIECEADRKESIDAILERNPDAFGPKIASSPHGATDAGVEHKKGCNCKKSGCFKKYCECFQASILCSDRCKCTDCKNFEGSEEMKALSHGHPANSSTSIQQATNSAISAVVRTPPCKKTRNRQIVFRETCSTSYTSQCPLSVHLLGPAASTTLGPSKSSYRVPLAGILQLQQVKDFCTHLVEVSAEAAKSHSEERKMTNNGTDVNVAETFASSHEDSKDNQNQHDAGELCGNQESELRTWLCEPADSGIQNGKPLSPGTFALMCDEQDATFMTARSPPPITECNTRTTMKSASTLGLNPLYVQQERLVLMRFRDFLSRLITCGCVEDVVGKH